MRCYAFFLLLPILAGCGQREPLDQVMFEEGQELFQFHCGGCHTATGRTNRIGPHLQDLPGRVAGSVADFPYSDALADSGIVWHEATLSAYIADPLGYLPGTTMGVSGIGDQSRRQALVYYLFSLTR